ncbi:MAG: hypothetical protein LBM73_00840 [Candidatus Nomurabacteria bacterium]|jgi:hypothetical protein|nr:hypothetical protein [Candidatus Nomurabacteria bacterium]
MLFGGDDPATSEPALEIPSRCANCSYQKFLRHKADELAKQLGLSTKALARMSDPEAVRQMVQLIYRSSQSGEEIPVLGGTVKIPPYSDEDKIQLLLLQGIGKIFNKGESNMREEIELLGRLSAFAANYCAGMQEISRTELPDGSTVTTKVCGAEPGTLTTDLVGGMTSIRPTSTTIIPADPTVALSNHLNLLTVIAETKK